MNHDRSPVVSAIVCALSLVAPGYAAPSSSTDAQTPAASQALGYTVTVTVTGVRSASGRVTGSLCNEAPTVFCSTYVARTSAADGQAVLRFTDVRPGRYALSTVHDEDGDGRTEIPPEGFAFGHNAASPVFDSVAIVVASDFATAVTMTYPGAGPAPQGSRGAPPPAGVVRTEVREQGLYGQLYRSESMTGRMPAVILLDGSNGGLDGVSTLAPAFAQRGIAALALAYFAELGLPQTLENIPLEYFDRALAVLRARDDVDGDRIGVFGVSKGAEAALLVAARNPAVRAVVGVGPSHVVWRGLNWADPAASDAAWTVNGAPLPFLSPDLALYDPNGSQTPMFTAVLDRAGDRPDVVIPAERINGPILLISGGDDRVWPSPLMAGRLVERLRKAGFAHPLESVVYPGVDHYVFVANTDALDRSIIFFTNAFRSARP